MCGERGMEKGGSGISNTCMVLGLDPVARLK